LRAAVSTYLEKAVIIHVTKDENYFACLEFQLDL
jgi:hypothetical protein